MAKGLDGTGDGGTRICDRLFIVVASSDYNPSDAEVIVHKPIVTVFMTSLK